MYYCVFIKIKKMFNLIPNRVSVCYCIMIDVCVFSNTDAKLYNFYVPKNLKHMYHKLMTILRISGIDK